MAFSSIAVKDANITRRSSKNTLRIILETQVKFKEHLINKNN